MEISILEKPIKYLNSEDKPISRGFWDWGILGFFDLRDVSKSQNPPIPNQQSSRLFILPGLAKFRYACERPILAFCDLCERFCENLRTGISIYKVYSEGRF